MVNINMESRQSEQARMHLQTALNALQTVSPNHITEILSFHAAPPVICSIIQAIAILFRVISKADGTQNSSWGSVKVILRPIPEFLNKLKTFHENNPRIEINVRNAALSALGNEMTEASLRTYSIACPPLFVWITNIVKYYELCENGQ